jgi:hypothetical protein
VRLRHFHIVAGIVTAGLLALISGCDNSFDPRGTYQKQLVVYSILSNTSDSQYVRVFTTYDPVTLDPGSVTTDTYVRNAVVTLRDDSATYIMRDTTITRVDKSRYKEDIGAYIAFPCPARPGKTYTLSIGSDQGNATGTVSVPEAGYVQPNNPFLLKSPDQTGSEDITVTVRFSSVMRGFLVRLYLDYEVLEGANWVHKREEVPTSTLSVTGSTVIYNYPKLTRRTTDLSQPYMTVHFPITVYSGFFKAIVNKYGPSGYKLLTATYILTQVETNLYKYYNLANGFQDEFSIRTDQPDYSNIQGGFGVLGAMRVDSVRVDL